MDAESVRRHLSLFLVCCWVGKIAHFGNMFLVSVSVSGLQTNCSQHCRYNYSKNHIFRGELLLYRRGFQSSLKKKRETNMHVFKAAVP